MQLKHLASLLTGSILPILGGATLLAVPDPTYALPFISTYNFNNSSLGGTTDQPGIQTPTDVTVAGGLTSNFPDASLVRFNEFSVASTLNEYISFTVAPNTNFSINFSTVGFVAATNANGPGSIFLRSNQDSFASNIGGTLTLANLPTFTTNSFNISSLANIISPTEFRIYGTNASGALPRALRFDEVTITGEVTPIPFEFEAGTGLILIGGYFVGKRYLKKRQNTKP
jgi:hypothetical protein